MSDDYLTRFSDRLNPQLLSFDIKRESSKDDGAYARLFSGINDYNRIIHPNFKDNRQRITSYAQKRGQLCSVGEMV